MTSYQGGVALPVVDTHRMFARGEMVRLCKEALASGPKTTKELALHVMRQGAGARYGAADDASAAVAMAARAAGK